MLCLSRMAGNFDRIFEIINQGIHDLVFEKLNTMVEYEEFRKIHYDQTW